MTPSPLRALVTGATGGIGRATAFALLEDAQRRARPLSIAVVASKPGAPLDALVGDLTAAGAKATGLAADLADVEACVDVARRAVAACDGLDVLVSNAGITRSGPLATLDPAQWDLVFDVDVRATWLLARTAHEALAASRGAVVAVGSISGLHPFAGLGAYSPAKAALIMLCRQLAQEWAPDGIRVNSVSPGLIHTPLTDAIYRDDDLRRRREAIVPRGRIGRPEDIAKTIVHLAGPDADYITGIDVLVDGGLCDGNLGRIPGRPRA
jgi:NAD(P)-dependent dehydrogenase (short-subunit alcohol dehydrogenase family)